MSIESRALTSLLQSKFRNRQLFIYQAMKMLGRPYYWGGNGPAEVDCSGLIYWLRRSIGVPFVKDETAEGLRQLCAKVIYPLPGALAFFGKTKATHVAIVLEPQGNVILGAQKGGPPRPDEDKEEYRERMRQRGACVSIETRGVSYRDDFLGYGELPALR